MSHEFEIAKRVAETHAQWVREQMERKKRLEQRERVLENFQRTVRELAESVERMKAGMN